MRYLGVDYGKKRMGMAVADDSTGIAIPRGIVMRQNDAAAIGEIKSIVRREQADKIIIGIPLGLDGNETETSGAARQFGDRLGKATGLPVEFENEMLTTRMARHALVSKKDIDAASAAIILQSYLDKKNQEARSKY